MLRIAISVEGATEREFVTKVLQPHFMAQNVCIQPVDLGGNVSLDRATHEITKLLFNFDAVSTFYDFYGFKKRNNCSVSELEKCLLDRISPGKKQKFIPYIQQYEFEALLFADPNIIATELSQPHNTKELIDIINVCGGAENINDGYETCPSRRLSELFLGYNKKLHGPVICEKIGLDKIRAQCQRFNKWIIDLEKISQDSISHTDDDAIMAIIEAEDTKTKKK